MNSVLRCCTRFCFTDDDCKRTNTRIKNRIKAINSWKNQQTLFHFLSERLFAGDGTNARDRLVQRGERRSNTVHDRNLSCRLFVSGKCVDQPILAFFVLPYLLYCINLYSLV